MDAESGRNQGPVQESFLDPGWQGCRYGKILLPTCLEQEEIPPVGCSKRLSSKAGGESKPEAYPQGYVEDFDEPRTKQADFFSIRLKE